MHGRPRTLAKDDLVAAADAGATDEQVSCGGCVLHRDTGAVLAAWRSVRDRGLHETAEDINNEEALALVRTLDLLAIAAREDWVAWEQRRGRSSGLTEHERRSLLDIWQNDRQSWRKEARAALDL